MRQQCHGASGTVASVKQRTRFAAVAGRCALAATIGAAAVSCGTAELDVETTFDDTWRVSELATNDDTVPLDGQMIEIEIDTGQAAVRGISNCQRFFGSYTLEDGSNRSGDASFTIPSPAASTDCSTDDRAVHEAVVDALESVTTWERIGSKLTLSSPSGARLTLEAANR